MKMTEMKVCVIGWRAGGEGRGLLRNCGEHIDNIITPLMHHRNTANEDDRNEGMCDWVEGGRGRGGAGQVLRKCGEHKDTVNPLYNDTVCSKLSLTLK